MEQQQGLEVLLGLPVKMAMFLNPREAEKPDDWFKVRFTAPGKGSPKQEKKTKMQGDKKFLLARRVGSRHSIQLKEIARGGTASHPVTNTMRVRFVRKLAALQYKRRRHLIRSFQQFLCGGV